MVFRAIDLGRPCIPTLFDASTAQEEGYKSQEGFVSLLTDTRVLTESAPVNLLEYYSGVIKRVVNSTMSAESAALGTAFDRNIYARVLTQQILYGRHPLPRDWRDQLIVQGVMITDARSLNDHLHKNLHKTGGISRNTRCSWTSWESGPPRRRDRSRSAGCRASGTTATGHRGAFRQMSSTEC